MKRWFIAIAVGLVLATLALVATARFTSDTLVQKKNLAGFNMKVTEADQFKLDLADFIAEFW